MLSENLHLALERLKLKQEGLNPSVDKSHYTLRHGIVITDQPGIGTTVGADPAGRCGEGLKHLGRRIHASEKLAVVIGLREPRQMIKFLKCFTLRRTRNHKSRHPKTQRQ